MPREQEGGVAACPDTATPASDDAGASVSGGEDQTFWTVRRQRLQALTFETLPSVTRVIGWRLGSHRRRARLRFIPMDWGFQPVIGRLPQMSQTRAMVESDSIHKGAGAWRRAIGMVARYDRAMQSSGPVRA